MGRSQVWNYFTKVSTTSAKCNLCKPPKVSVIGCKGSSTGALITHLKLHSIDINQISLEDENPSRSVQTNLNRFIKAETLPEILAKCAAKDGFSFNAILHSSTIRGYISFKGLSMPE